MRGGCERGRIFPRRFRPSSGRRPKGLHSRSHREGTGQVIRQGGRRASASLVSLPDLCEGGLASPCPLARCPASTRRIQVLAISSNTWRAPASPRTSPRRSSSSHTSAQTARHPASNWSTNPSNGSRWLCGLAEDAQNNPGHLAPVGPVLRGAECLGLYPKIRLMAPN
jgi:hypothetical protein